MQKLIRMSLPLVSVLLVLNGLINIFDNGMVLAYDITSILSGIGLGIVFFLLQKKL